MKSYFLNSHCRHQANLGKGYVHSQPFQTQIRHLLILKSHSFSLGQPQLYVPSLHGKEFLCRIAHLNLIILCNPDGKDTEF